MVAPYLRDVSIQPPRVNSAGSQGRVQEMQVVCYTGRASTNCTVVAEYGPTTSYGTTTAPTPSGGRHEFPIGDLSPGATYHVRIKATDPTDVPNPAYSQDYTLTQPWNEVPAGPTFIHQPVSGITSTGATVNWTTSVACPPSTVQYSTSPTLSPLSTKAETGGSVTTHAVALTGLTTATRYYYRVLQTYPSGGTYLSSLNTFVTA